MCSGTFEIERYADHVVVRGVGAIGVDQLREVIRSLSSDDLETTPHARLWDLRGADLSALRSLDIEDFAELSRSQGTLRRRIAVVVTTDLQYGLTRMYESFHGETPHAAIAVFRDEAEARAWLEVPPSSAGAAG